MYTPPKTWIPKITIFERRYILKTIIFGIYVKFQGVTYYNKTRRNAENSIYPPSSISPTSYTCHATIPPKTSRSQVLIILHRQAKVSNEQLSWNTVNSDRQSIYNIWKTKHWRPKKNGGLQKYDVSMFQKEIDFQSSTSPFRFFGEKKKHRFQSLAASPRNHSLWSQCVLLLHHRVDDRSMFEASTRKGFIDPNRVHRSILHPWKSNWATHL